MAYKLVLSKSAERDLKKIDKKEAIRILDKLEYFASTDNPRHYAKDLKDHEGLVRFRVGDYRAVSEIKETEITIYTIRIGHRKNIYQWLNGD